MLWALFTYTIFTVLTVKRDKPSLADGINGGWLLAVVAAQSVASLGAQLAPSLAPYESPALLFCLVMWLGGGMLYLWIIGLIFYRYTFFTMSPSDLAPPYWINMGAAAISALAGTTLIVAAPHSSFGVWRHACRRFPLRYDPLYWGAVFPLGMYTVCTARLAGAVDAPYLLLGAQVFVYVAVAAWSIVMVGFVLHLRSQR